MMYWRATQHDTGRVLEACGTHMADSFDLASDMVDLAWKFMGQGDTVTLELVDESGTVLERRAPHPKPMPIDPDRLAGLLKMVLLLLALSAPARADVFTAAAIAGAAGDIVTTEVALSRGYVEQNVGYRPLRIGANALITGACLVAAHEVGRSGHHGWATALKLVPAVVFGGLAIKNMNTMRGGLR